MKASGKAVSRSNLRTTPAPSSSSGSSSSPASSPSKPRKGRAKGRARVTASPDFLARPEVKSAITRLKEKYSQPRQVVNRINQAAENYAANTPAHRFDKAQKPGTDAMDSAIKDMIGRPALSKGRVKSFRGKPLAGAPPVRQVIQASRKGTLKQRGKELTTPEVRTARRKVKRVSGRLSEARKATAGGKVGALKQAGLDPEQARILATVLKTGDQMGATQKEKLSAVQTALVESNISNPTVATDHDSLGWRQERQMYYDNPTNVKASATRYFQETAEAGRGAGVSPGTLAQSVQRSAFPERYDERTAEAMPLLKAFDAAKGGSPKAQRKLEQVTKVAEDIDKEARKLGLPGVRGLSKEGARSVAKVFVAKQRKGDYAGSQQMVTQMIGAKVWGDKEEGHSAGGDHDPTVGDAYAQDIQLGADNPSEGEPTYDQGLLDKLTRRIRGMGGDIPDLEMGMGMVETNVQGYRIQIIPDSESNFHGSGPHLHIGAKWTGENPPPGTRYGGAGGSNSGFATASYPLGGGAATTSSSAPSVVAGDPKKGRKQSIRDALAELGFQVTASGVSGGTKTAAAPEVSPVMAELAKKYL